MIGKEKVMKVTIGKDVYLVHWKTSKFSPEIGRHAGIELEATDCIIDKLDKDGFRMEISRGHVSQTYCDQSNSVTARRLSFVKAISGLDKGIRRALGHEYNRTCRVTSRSPLQKNRCLRKRVAELSAKVAELEREKHELIL